MEWDKLNNYLIDQVLMGIKDHQHNQEAVIKFIYNLELPENYQKVSATKSLEMIIDEFSEVKLFYIEKIKQIEPENWEKRLLDGLKHLPRSQ